MYEVKFSILEESEILSRAFDKEEINYRYRGSMGVYFLIDGPEIVYVGKATSLHVRIKDHLKENKKQFDKVAVITEGDKNRLDMMEAIYIMMLTPKYNKQASLKAIAHGLLYNL